MAHVRVFVTTGKRATRVTGYDPWRKAWAVDVAAVPERGAANRELLRYLSERLGLTTGDVAMVRGERLRLKVVSTPATEEQVAARLETKDGAR